MGHSIRDKMYVSLRWRVMLSASAQIQMDQSELTMKPRCEGPLSHGSSQAFEESRRGEFKGKVFVLHESYFGHRRKPHLQNLTRKISKSLGIIYKSSFCLNKNSSYTLYYSLVYPYLYYCACLWGLTYHSYLKRLVTLQKRAVRMISRSAFDAHTDPIFKSLKLLKFENIVALHVAKIMYLYKNGQLPESFKNMFFTGPEIHNYNTRNSNLFRLPSGRTNVRKFSLRFQGPKIFNSINDEIKKFIKS